MNILYYNAYINILHVNYNSRSILELLKSAVKLYFRHRSFKLGIIRIWVCFKRIIATFIPGNLNLKAEFIVAENIVRRMIMRFSQNMLF